METVRQGGIELEAGGRAEKQASEYGGDDVRLRRYNDVG